MRWEMPLETGEMELRGTKRGRPREINWLSWLIYDFFQMTLPTMAFRRRETLLDNHASL
jgi:hypothetical protein